MAKARIACFCIWLVDLAGAIMNTIKRNRYNYRWPSTLFKTFFLLFNRTMEQILRGEQAWSALLRKKNAATRMATIITTYSCWQVAHVAGITNITKTGTLIDMYLLDRYFEKKFPIDDLSMNTYIYFPSRSKRRELPSNNGKLTLPNIIIAYSFVSVGQYIYRNSYTFL